MVLDKIPNLGDRKMYGLTFDLDTEVLADFEIKRSVAYRKIEKELRKCGYIHPQYSVYICTKPQYEMLAITQAVKCLEQFEWFKEAVRSIFVFEVDKYSDITEYFKD